WGTEYPVLSTEYSALVPSPHPLSPRGARAAWLGQLVFGTMHDQLKRLAQAVGAPVTADPQDQVAGRVVAVTLQQQVQEGHGCLFRRQAVALGPGQRVVGRQAEGSVAPDHVVAPVATRQEGRRVEPGLAAVPALDVGWVEQVLPLPLA